MRSTPRGGGMSGRVTTTGPAAWRWSARDRTVNAATTAQAAACSPNAMFAVGSLSSASSMTPNSTPIAHPVSTRPNSNSSGAASNGTTASANSGSGRQGRAVVHGASPAAPETTNASTQPPTSPALVTHHGTAAACQRWTSMCGSWHDHCSERCGSPPVEWVSAAHIDP
ncbi:hypothetical protein ACVDFE_15560 [Lentzea chajnantorensis]